LLSEKFDVGKNEKINISEYKTIGSIIELVKGSFKKEEPSFEDAKGEVAAVESIDDEDVNIQKDLCLQIPVFVEKEAKGEDFDLKDKRFGLWVTMTTGKEGGTIFRRTFGRCEEFVFEYRGRSKARKGCGRVYKQKP